jgi:hypothetical protein
MLKDFMFQKINQVWFVPVIQGFIECSTSTFLGNDLNMVLISRRRFARSGTRFNARGIDEAGNVANFCETEMIILYNKAQMRFSHLQVRGSVPLFWNQKSKGARIALKDNLLTSRRSTHTSLL